MTDDLMNRFDDVEDEESEDEELQSMSDSSPQTGTDRTQSIRERSQVPMYLSEALQEDLDETFELRNAQRTIDGKPKMEKNRDFLEAVVRAGLESDWEEYLEME